MNKQEIIKKYGILVFWVIVIGLPFISLLNRSGGEEDAYLFLLFVVLIGYIWRISLGKPGILDILDKYASNRSNL